MERVTFVGAEISVIAELLRNRIRELKIEIEYTVDEDERDSINDDIQRNDDMLKEIERQTGWKVRA